MSADATPSEPEREDSRGAPISARSDGEPNAAVSGSLGAAPDTQESVQHTTLDAPDGGTERCPRCGGDAGDNWFDRSICACGRMHTCCRNCGFALDGCPYDAPAEAKPPLPAPVTNEYGVPAWFVERFDAASKAGFSHVCLYCGAGVDEQGVGDHRPECDRPAAPDTAATHAQTIRQAISKFVPLGDRPTANEAFAALVALLAEREGLVSQILELARANDAAVARAERAEAVRDEHEAAAIEFCAAADKAEARAERLQQALVDAERAYDELVAQRIELRERTERLQRFADYVAMVPATTGGASMVSAEVLAEKARDALAAVGGGHDRPESESARQQTPSADGSLCVFPACAAGHGTGRYCDTCEPK